MASHNQLAYVGRNYVMFPEDGHGAVKHLEAACYIVPVRWGSDSGEFEERLKALINEYISIPYIRTI